MSEEKANPYHPLIHEAFEQQTSFCLEFLGDTPNWRIHGLDFGYDVAELVALDTVYVGERQFVSLGFLLRLLSGDTLPPLAYRYVCRWYDEKNIAHYFGIYSKHPTIEEAQKHTKFNMIGVPVDIVYAPMDETDLYSYLADVLNKTDDNDPDDLGSLGSFDWL